MEIIYYIYRIKTCVNASKTDYNTVH
ncbi:uncharacterized protein METZ01_LOCUS288106, partial [marine metagenome]